MLNLLSSEHQTLAELAGPLLKRYAKIPETNFSVPDGAGAIKRLEQEYAPNAVAVSHLDGVRIDFKDWWFNVRSSNTEPLLRLNLEANTPELLQIKLEELTKTIGS